eukprot:11168672-Lingulodinium_polyedra.AAC.1
MPIGRMCVLRKCFAHSWRQHSLQRVVWARTTNAARHRAGGLPGGSRTAEPGLDCSRSPIA